MPDHKSDTPLHLQLKDELFRQLRALPANGEYKLPSERSLVELFKINRSTIHRAYAELLNSGWVVRNPDKSLSVANGIKKRLQGDFPMIGLVLPFRFSEYVEHRMQRSFQYIKGIIDRAESRKVSIITLQLPPPDSDADVIDSFIETRCAPLCGLIHLGNRSNKDNVMNSILNYRGIPQIFISGEHEFKHIGSVCSDPATGARELAAELKRLNIKTFGTISRDKSNEHGFNYAAALRGPAVRRELQNAGLKLLDNWCIPARSDDYLEAEKIPRDGELPELIWCSSDTLAQQLRDELQSRGVRVPEDVSIIGFNGYFHDLDKDPHVATIRHPFYPMGETAVDMLLEYFVNGLTPQNRRVLLPTSFLPGVTLRKEPLQNR